MRDIFAERAITDCSSWITNEDSVRKPDVRFSRGGGKPQKGEKISYMKLLDVSTPGKRKKRVLNVLSSGWMAVVRWITSGGLLHEGGQTKPERQGIRDDLMVVSMSNAAVSGTGRRLRNALPPCGQVTWHCFVWWPAFRRGTGVLFLLRLLCMGRRSWPTATRTNHRCLDVLATGPISGPGRIPAEQRRQWSGGSCDYCPGTDQQFFIREPGRALRTG